MTAPLPPLPYWMVHTLSAAEQADVAAHAKLAVREALERAKEAMYEQGAKDRAACAAIVRAMIEEYSK